MSRFQLVSLIARCRRIVAEARALAPIISNRQAIPVALEMPAVARYSVTQLIVSE